MSEEAQTEKLAVSVKDGAQMTGIGRDLMYQLVLSGDIPSFKVRSRRLISVAALRAYVEQRTAEARDAQLAG